MDFYLKDREYLEVSEAKMKLFIEKRELIISKEKIVLPSLKIFFGDKDNDVASIEFLAQTLSFSKEFNNSKGIEVIDLKEIHKGISYYGMLVKNTMNCDNGFVCLDGIKNTLTFSKIALYGEEEISLKSANFVLKNGIDEWIVSNKVANGCLTPSDELLDRLDDFLRDEKNADIKAEVFQYNEDSLRDSLKSGKEFAIMDFTAKEKILFEICDYYNGR